METLFEKVAHGGQVKNLNYGPMPPIPDLKTLTIIRQQGDYLYKHGLVTFAIGQGIMLLAIMTYLNPIGGNP
jgi:hypothetical protein